MTLGLENRKQVGFLAALLLLLAYLLYANVFSTSAPSSAGRAEEPAPAAAPTPAPAAAPAATTPAPRPVSGNRGRTDGFHPVFRARRPEDRPDVTRIDPTLHLEVLAKLERQAGAGNGRNLFQFAAPPPPPPSKALPKQPEPVIVPGPPRTAAPVNMEPPPPPPPPYKFYGYSVARGRRSMAFFMDGDASVLVGEGDVIKKRYKVVRVSKTNVVLEDVDSKRQHTLRITEEAGER